MPAGFGGLPGSWTVVHPGFPPYRGTPVGPTFHPKLLLLDFGCLLRVVVSSANAAAWEWTDVTQNVWVFDAPLKKRHRAPKASSSGPPPRGSSSWRSGAREQAAAVKGSSTTKRKAPPEQQQQHDEEEEDEEGGGWV